jgi:hypothetical protein
MLANPQVTATKMRAAVAFVRIFLNENCGRVTPPFNPAERLPGPPATSATPNKHVRARADRSDASKQSLPRQLQVLESVLNPGLIDSAKAIHCAASFPKRPHHVNGM